MNWEGSNVDVWMENSPVCWICPRVACGKLMSRADMGTFDWIWQIFLEFQSPHRDARN